MVPLNIGYPGNPVVIVRVRRIATAQRTDRVLIPDSVRDQSLGPEPVLRECAGGRRGSGT
jgi:hypothetical protein